MSQVILHAYLNKAGHLHGISITNTPILKIYSTFHTNAVKCDYFSDRSVLRVSRSVRLLQTTDQASVSIAELHSHFAEVATGCPCNQAPRHDDVWKKWRQSTTCFQFREFVVRKFQPRCTWALWGRLPSNQSLLASYFNAKQQEGWE